MRGRRELTFPSNAVADITYIDIREAVLRREFFFEFQPKVDLRTGAVESVEALIRWQHSARGRVSPHEFLLLIERTTLMRRLTAITLDDSLAHCAAFRKEGFDVGVSVNLSPSAVTDELPEQVLCALGNNDVKPGKLTLEITRTDEFGDVAHAVEILEAIRANGVRLALDDFGTGHSTLTRLCAVPFDELKIDGSFVGRAWRSPRDAHIIRFSAELGRALGMRVVAEGVEDELTVALMHAYGVDAAQGFHFALPMSAADLLADFDKISTSVRARALSRSVDLRPYADARPDGVVVDIDARHDR